MATISIPSPSVILSTSPVLRTLSLPTRPPQRRQPRGVRAAPGTRQRQRQRQSVNGIIKPKQSKSRDGCQTCKKKRLKCDETKPSCLQCQKRNVPCGGYYKELKWKPSNFEEAVLNNRQARQAFQIRTRRTSIPSPETTEVPNHASPRTPDTTTSEISSTSSYVEVDTQSNSSPETLPKIEDAHGRRDSGSSSSSTVSDFPSSVPIFFETPSHMEDSYPQGLFSEPSASPGLLDSMFEELSVTPFLTNGSNFPEYSPMSDIHTGATGFDLIHASNDPWDTPEDLESIEDIPRTPHFPNDESWATEVLFRNPYDWRMRRDFFTPMYNQPEMHWDGSYEMVMLRFEKQTCGILSIKNGPSENPWRTLIWPLALESPALYHAIASMTAFHTSKGDSGLHFEGIKHMMSSISLLKNGLSNMRPDIALATTLVLAFSESWDQHISTGIRHLHGAKDLLNQLTQYNRRRSLTGDDLARLKFLCNTFIYMDVIARLTSVDADETDDFESLISPIPTPFGNLGTAEMDPLMGCASTLFPLIGRAANLCRRARNSESNSLPFIEQAMELKEQIEQWESGSMFENPEDPSSEVRHALRTAEAYRYATLLYLHQAVPEMLSSTSAELAKKVLVNLVTVPFTSRLVIVQIYPLLAAGCEANEPSDRQWVQDRWQSMSDRMWIGNIDRCYEVMMEVWRRRDAFVAEKEAARMRGKQKNQRRSMGMAHTSSPLDISKEMSEAFSFSDMLSGNSSLGGLKRDLSHRGVSGRSVLVDGESRMGVSCEPRRRNSEPNSEDMEREYTVRGQLHWVGVMKDWGWEVLLG